MAKPVDKSLNDYIAPGRLSDPFGQKTTGRSKIPQVLPSEIRPVANRPLAKIRSPFEQKRDWPYPVSFNTDRILDQAIIDGEMMEEEVPLLMQIAQAVGKVLGRPSPTATDLQFAMGFRTIERIKQMISGEINYNIPQSNMKNPGGMMNPMQMKTFWTSLAKGVLEIFEPTPVVVKETVSKKGRNG
jgi:hypothetical protein